MSLSPKQERDAAPPDVITAAEAAALLRVSLKSIYKAVKKGAR